MIKICPLCGKKLKETYVDTLEAWGGSIMAEQTLECECGYSYEFSYGAKRKLFKGEEIRDT
jgi:C4-type Zn-finger protein